MQNEDLVIRGDLKHASSIRGAMRIALLALGLLALLLPALPRSAAAQIQVTFTSAVALWHDPTDNVPGVQPGDPVITNGAPTTNATPTTSSISWGTTSGTPQSGYDVTMAIPDPLQFPVATFSHRNFAVSDPSLTSVQLDIILDFMVNGVQTGPLTFTFLFNHEETPNNLNPCPYPTPPGEGCTDRVTFVSSPAPTTFTVGGKTYTMGMTFLDANGNPVTEFITREGGIVNTADLDGSFVLVPPVLEVTKSGPATMTIGQSGVFAIDTRNTGPNDAWNTTIRDVLPDGATGGMCDATPQVLSAQVFAADGVTPVPGKGPLVAGTDYTLSYAGAPTCELSLAMLTPKTAIDTDQRLIITYQTQLDAGTQDGTTLTNVAGATEWFDDEISNPDRVTFTRTLTNGTPGTVDFQDAHTVTASLRDYLFEKTVMDVTSGANPATTATPGDRLRYRLRFQNRGTTPISNLSIFDELDAMNTTAAFQPGTLAVVTAPAGADTTATNATGGAKGTGVLDVRNLSLPGAGEIVVEFEVVLAPVLANGSVVANQSTLRLAGAAFARSDDPNVNGPADPFVAGDEDPTRLTIQSAPLFRIQKISTDLTADPNVLLAGETLLYTITVKNIGTADAVNVALRDAVPANTTYVAGSTTLNGSPVPDGPGATSPLVAGILVHAPENATPGFLRADASVTTANVATITFRVVVGAGVPDGTVISNQGFVSAPGAGIVDRPSDDPTTAAPDDPTLDIVGSTPLLFAPKQVALLVDANSNGIVDPGDVLHYTITILNHGAVAATGVVIQDAVPANTTYVANTTTLNGLPVGQPDGGAAPLAAGIPISSSNLTPPLPGPGGGTVSPGQSAVLGFNLQVNAGTPAGTIISNQAVVRTAQLPDLLTDGDGNPATGPEPTLVVVGDAQQIRITKQVTVVGGGAALAGATLDYVVRVQNIAAVPVTAVVITDDLPAGQLAYVAGSATLNGVATGVSVVGSLITADYSGTYGPLPPGGVALLHFRAVIAPGLAMGTTITNTGVVTWNTPTQTASASVSVDVGGIPGVGLLSGNVWHDANFDDALGATERVLPGWIVELFGNGSLQQSVTTDANGHYQIGNVVPNTGSGVAYELRFRAPDAGPSSAKLGRASSPFTNQLQLIRDIVVPSGSNLQQLNLPIHPNGVVYGSIPRTPIAGATLSLLDGTNQALLPSACFDDPVQQGQVTRGDGYYKFDINFSDPACPSGGTYLISVTPPGGAFAPGYSTLIPPTSGPTTAALSVPACPGSANDAVPATATFCEAQTSEFAPPTSVPARSPGTTYHVHLLLDGSQAPGSSEIFNNHIPLDPVLAGLVAVTKTTPSLYVSRGQLVPYEITFSTDQGVEIPELTLVDRYPAGFRYVDGSAQVDGQKLEPTKDGNQLTWTNIGTGRPGSHSLRMLLAVGAGVSQGEYPNRVRAISSLNGAALSGEATATVRVVPDPTFDCTDVMGKVFDDVNQDGVQDESEKGLPGVRVATTNGLVATTDPYGRFHITCAIVPREDRGSNFVLKLDDRTLPTGYRMTTRQVQVQRATAGKALVYHFGASIQRVIGLDVADAVFEPGTVEMRPQWRPRLALLFEQLQKERAILRLSYLADVESAELVDRRVRALKDEITRAWKEQGGYALTIETEIYWRRGAPPEEPGFHLPGLPSKRSLESLLPSVDAGPPVQDGDPGAAVERHLSTDTPFTRWSQDPAQLDRQSGDLLERREVPSLQPKTVKLRNVVPPIHFDSGVADIPASTIEKLRRTLDGMRDLKNVRLHLVGHADDQPLSPALSRVYGDNEGLSEERAGRVAEFMQSALGLPPEAISFEWAGDSQPIASNATDAGRAQNRRVEVEIWYDQTEEKRSLEDVVVPQEIKRVKVCRTETVCMLRYREGQAHRARVRNLIAPLHYGDEGIDVPDAFVRQVEQTLHDLRDKQNVTVKFIGYTDDRPLEGRAERMYGTPLALSKARARRVALAVQDALHLPTAAVDSDGGGATRPLAPNGTDRGRALNRRVEVEFWHDDPLQELSDEPQMCPDAAGAETVTQVYEPAWGPLPQLAIENGEAVIPPGFEDSLRRALSEVAERAHARVRFVGYTRNERLDRRTAVVYGDDIGLSASRARRAMEKIQADLGLTDAQVEHEGRGYVQSDDVVNAGFVQGDQSFVVAQVVYDDLAALEDYEGVEVTPLTRELTPKDPLALNLMRITVDGVPIDDPNRGVADVDRCTDVALDRADIQFRFDDLQTEPRLSVTAQPIATAVTPDGSQASPVRFRAYSNYASFIDHSEVRIFEQGQSLQAEPVAVVPIAHDGVGEWQPPAASFTGPVRPLVYLLRAYDPSGKFDETSPQSLWMTHGEAPSTDQIDAKLLAGYGDSGVPLARNIPLGNVGHVEVHGSGIPAGHTVYFGGAPVPVDEHGDFVAELVVPSGLHTVEVSVLDPEGNGELFLRDLESKKNDWFYVAMADLTVAADISGGTPSALIGKNAPYDPESTADGRLAFYLNGKWGDGWKLTASADTREDRLQDLFSNFLEKTPDSLFRRIDPDYVYPTYGDDGTVDEMAPTQGKFFAKLSKDESHAMWGNFKVQYLDNELAHVDRGLYGGNLHYQTQGTTSFGEQKLAVDGFAAEPGTVPSREEFRGTSGSLYYLKTQDILVGSERVRIEVRDKDTGLVKAVVNLKPTLDYDIDYLQGRILLTEPVDATVSDQLLVRNQGLSGDEAWLVVQYEFTPGFDELNAMAAGGQGHWWLTDFLKFGLTANRNQGDGNDNNLYAADVTLRKSTDSWIKVQAGRTEGLVSTTLISQDGGFSFFGGGAQFFGAAPAPFTGEDANAYRADISVGASDWIDGARGKLNLYAQRMDAGYSAPGENALTDTEYAGGQLDVPVTDALDIKAKADWRKQQDALETRAAEVDLGYHLTDHWTLGAGVRNDKREDDSPVVVATQQEGERTDAVAQVGYDSKGRWRAYAFGQGTIDATGDREDNNRGGVGGAYRINDRLMFDGEVSEGNLGPAVKLGTSFQETEETRRYLSYAYDNERPYGGDYQRQGTLISGVKTRLSDSSSVFVEDRYQHGGYANGLVRAMGMTLAPWDHWTVSANWELGDLFNQQTEAETKRRAGGVRASYGYDRLQLSSGIEYRHDDTEEPDKSRNERTTWLFRNTFRFQITPDARLVGKFNHSFSDSSLGDFYNGGYTEAVAGFAYRPVSFDRFQALAKYTYLYNMPTADQVSPTNTAAEFVQKSHVFSIDMTYDLTKNWTLGGKYAYRLGQVSLDRNNPDFFDNDAHLGILRVDYRFLEDWEGSVEGRILDLPDQDDRRIGSLFTIYRYLGKHFKVGVGYNFTDYSEDLTDLSYDHHGVFFNVVGSM